MNNCTITLNTMLAWLGWLLAIACAGIDLRFGAASIGRIAILFAAAGATLNVRGMIYNLEHRERDAFDLGRESMRAVR